MQSVKTPVLAALMLVAAAGASFAQDANTGGATGGAAAAQRTEPEKKAQPFAFADFTWLTGNPRTTDSPIKTDVFTAEIRFDTNYTYSFNRPQDDTIGGSSEIFRHNEIQFGGFIDMAYLKDFNDPSNQLFRSRGTAWHVDDLFVNMAGVYAKKKATDESRWGAELLVQTGKDDEIFGFSATAPNIAGSKWLRHLGLANASYLAPVGSGLTVQAGIFPSLIGYDSLYAKDNFNYTRPWGADFTPYLMLGANASYPFSDKLTGTFFVVNGYWHLADANHVPSSGAQLAFKATPALSVKQTVLWGPHQEDTAFTLWRFLSDTIVEHRTERHVIAFEYNVATERVEATDHQRAWFMTAQLPMHWVVEGPWSVTVRPEVAWDSTGRWTLAEQTVKALTTTLEYRLPHGWSNTILRLEHRVDDSRGPQGGFFKDGGVSPGASGLTPTQHLLIFAVMFTFDSPAQR
jgi:hypothetical protein